MGEREMKHERAISRRGFLRVTTSGLALAAMTPVLAACQQAQPAQPAAPAKPVAQPTVAAAKPAVQPTAAAAAAKPAQAAPGGFTGGGSLKILVRSHFIPNYDTWLDQFAGQWAEKNNVDVTVDHILAGELPAKWAAEVASRAGHDMYGFTQSGAVYVYQDHLVDMGEVAKAVGERHGGWVTPLAENLGLVESTWVGVPDYFIDFPANYRKDLFDQNNLQPINTYEDLLRVGTMLKGQDHPIGIAVNQRSNDANNSWNSVLWGYGLSYAQENGRMANFNNPKTLEAIEFAVELYNKTMTNEVLSWDDSANNQFLASGRGSWIQNPISSLRTIEKQDPELARNVFISNAPAGPAGRFASVSTSVWGVMNWSQNAPAAKQFLTDYYANYREAFRASEGYNQPLLRTFREKPMPILGEEDKLNVLQDFDEVARAAGHPGPPTVAAAEVENNWTIPLMIGRAIQSNPQDAMDWATQRIETIYKKHNMA